MRTTIRAIAALLMLGSAANAADMGRPIPYQPPAMVAAPNWTGFYLGVNAGGAFGQDRIGFGVTGFPAFATIDNAFSGFVGGGQIGYNWQFNSLVAGVEADFQGTTAKGT